MDFQPQAPLKAFREQGLEGMCFFLQPIPDCYGSGDSCPSLLSQSITQHPLFLGSRSCRGVVAPHCDLSLDFFQSLVGHSAHNTICYSSSASLCSNYKGEFCFLLGLWALQLLPPKLCMCLVFQLHLSSQMFTTHTAQVPT